jgi:RimJ/RimL family protein N-acetyltransferase
MPLHAANGNWPLRDVTLTYAEPVHLQDRTTANDSRRFFATALNPHPPRATQPPLWRRLSPKPMTETLALPVVTTRRLRLEAFTTADIPALAAILAVPDVAKNIVANGSTPKRCLAAAAYRIDWHNRVWGTRGYGVWAIRSRDAELAPPGQVLGWCGFAEPDVEEDPEILYGVAPAYWRRGVAEEAARGAIDWLFAETAYAGVSAIIFGKLNHASVRMVGKLGMTRRGTMSMTDFLADPVRIRGVLDFEIWRLAYGPTADVEALLFEAPYKGGLFATLVRDDPAGIERAFCDAARARHDYAALDRSELDRRVRAAFRQGIAEPYLDWYHLPRAAWTARA